jgi:uncharacterized protein
MRKGAPTMNTYDPRYLAGVLLFNEQAFFEAHEVWEDLWTESHGPERRFVQGLIQAAVGLCHFGNGNLRGAMKLYRTSREYMLPCGSPFLGLDAQAFWQAMERCYGNLLTSSEPDRTMQFDPALAPRITLNPEPAEWPDPEAFLPEDEE